MPVSLVRGSWGRSSHGKGGTTIDDLTVSAVEPSPATSSAAVTRRQIRGSSLFLVGRVVALGVNFAVQVLIARYLSQATFGAFAYALSLVTLGETVVTLGLDRGVGRFLALYDERGDRARLLGTLALVVGAVLTLGLALILIVLGLQGLIAGTFVSDPQAATLLTILVVLAPIQAADNLFGGVLAVFANARSIFFRKYVVGPGLRLAVVVLLIGGGYDVDFLAVGYVITGLIGVLLYLGLLSRLLRNRELLSWVGVRTMRIPVREIFAFTIPLLTTDLVYVALHTTDAIFLAHFWGTTEVAAYRVVQPLVNLNQLVYSSFTLLYMPAAARLVAREDRDGVANLYWKTAIWMAVFSFPIFALTTSLAGPVTVALYQERYAGSAVYLAILSLAAYVNVALGFNGLTLRVFGFVRYTVAVNLIAAVVSVVLNLSLIPGLGALGATLATATALIVFNLLKQAGLRLGTGISLFDRHYLRVYVTIAIVALALLGLQLALHPGLVLSLVFAAGASAIVFAANRSQLAVAETFPEVLRLPFARRFLGV